MLEVLAEYAAAQGFPVAGSMVEDAGSLEFAHRFGFTESMRQVEQLRAIGDEPWPTPPGGAPTPPYAGSGAARAWRPR